MPSLGQAEILKLSRPIRIILEKILGFGYMQLVLFEMQDAENFCSRPWRSSLPVPLMLDPPLGPHRHERKHFGAPVLGGRGATKLNIFLSDFLTISGNSKHFRFLCSLATIGLAIFCFVYEFVSNKDAECPSNLILIGF